MRAIALGLVVCALGAGPAYSQPAPVDETAVAAAKSAFAAAEKAFAARDFEEALKLFRLAFEKAPRDAVRFNIAVCLAELGRYDDAHAEYELAAASSELTSEEKALARMRADELSPKLTPKPRDEPPPPAPKKVEHRHGLAGWLTITGSVVAAIGTGGLIGFGIRTEDLGQAYESAPSHDLRDEGLLMRGLANGSIGVLGLGALMIVGDLALFRTGETVEWSVGPTAAGMTIRF